MTPRSGVACGAGERRRGACSWATEAQSAAGLSLPCRATEAVGDYNHRERGQLRRSTRGWRSAPPGILIRMTIGSSILLIAVGAILKYAVTAHVSGFDIQTAGLVLLLLGILGLILSLLYTFMWSDQAQRRRRDYADYDAHTRNIPPRDRY